MHGASHPFSDHHDALRALLGAGREGGELFDLRLGGSVLDPELQEGRLSDLQGTRGRASRQVHRMKMVK